MRIQTRHVHAKVAQRLAEHVLRHPVGQIRLPHLASMVGMSQFHLIRVFKSQAGEPPASFARRIRLERAAYRLANTTNSVRSIAFETGYENSSAFFKEFRKAFGCGPAEFRASGNGEWRLPSPVDLHWVPTNAEAKLSPYEMKQAGPDVELVAMAPLCVGRKRLVGPYSEIAGAWQRIAQEAPAVGGGKRFLTVYHDSMGSKAASELRADLCVVRDDGRIEPGFEECYLTGGVFVRTKEFFSGEAANDAWCWMARHWIPGKGTRPVDVPAFSEALVSPGLVADAPIRVWIGLEMDWGETLSTNGPARGSRK